MMMRNTVKLWWTTGVLTVVLLVVFVAPVFAADTGGVGGKPANPRADNPRTQSIFVYELSPGQNVKDEVEIYNNTEEQKTIKVYSTDSIISSGGAFACAQAADQINDVGNWIKLSKDLVTLAPSKSEKVGFTVTIPDYAEPGEHNGCIAMQEADAEAASVGNGIALSFRSAIRVAITVPGDIKKELTIRSVSLRQKSDKLVGTILLRNNGNVSLDTSVETKLVNVFGTQTEAINGTYPALPQTITELNFEYKQPYWGGLHKLNVNAFYNSNIADSLGEGSDSSSVEAASYYVFITPRPLALLIELAVTALAAFGIWYIVNRFFIVPRKLQKYVEYTVGKNEDLQTIAKKYQTNWKHLAKANSIKAPYVIKQGDTLKVPNVKDARDVKPKPFKKDIGTKQITKSNKLATIAIESASKTSEEKADHSPAIVTKEAKVTAKPIKKTSKKKTSSKTKPVKKKNTKKNTTKKTTPKKANVNKE